MSVLQPTPSLAEAAYAFGQGEFGAWVSGYGNNYTSQNAAQIAAMEKCINRGIVCSIIANFRKTCFAIAVQDLGNGWAVRYGADIPTASRSALQGCASMGMSCSVRDTFCDSVSEQELQQAAIDQANRALQEYQREWNECFAATGTEVDAAAAIGSCNQALSFPNAVPADRDNLVRQRAVLQGRIQQIHEQNLRAEQQRRKDEADKQAYDQYYALQEACEQFHEDACTAALRSPLADDDDRAQMRTNLALAQRFKDDLAACRNGSASACDIALMSPVAGDNDRRYLEQWRAAASPFNKAIAAIGHYWGVLQFLIAFTPPSTLIATTVAAVLAFVLIGVLMWQRRRKFRRTPSAIADSLSNLQPEPDRPQPEIVPPAPETAASEVAHAPVSPAADVAPALSTAPATDVVAAPAVPSKLDKSAIKQALTASRVDKAADKPAPKTTRVEFEL